MISIKMVDGDFAFDEKGHLIMVEGDQELAQSCELILGTNRGEWFLNPDFGIDFSVFRGKNLNNELVTDEVMAGLLQEERLDSIEDIYIQQDTKNRKATVNFTVKKTDGTLLESQGVNLIND